jgi:predicted metal-binding membrane protein
MTGTTPAAARPGNPARRWERGLLAALAGLSALAWLVTGRWPMPGMRLGVLTGSDTRGLGGGGTAPMALGLFLLTWAVMMAAMMLPAPAPVVLAVGR